MKGLVIKEPWIDFILNGRKVWEIRGANTKIRGKIALIKSGTGMIFGTVNLVDSKKLGVLEYQNSEDKHCIKNTECNLLPYKNIYAWVLENPVIFKNPIQYKHPHGAVIWVNLDDKLFES